MTTGATGQLGLALPVQGELSGTWGDTVNNGITQYTNIAIAGTLTLTGDGAVTLANTTGDASASNITSTLAGAGTVTAQFAIVRVTGTLTVAKVVTGPSYSKTYTVVNAATGGIVTFKASGQTGVSVAVGESAFVYFNGTDYVKLAGTVAVASFQTSLSGLTPSTATTGAVTLAGTLGVASGGTGLTAGTSGGVLGYTATGTLASSVALTANALVLGAGAGATPTPMASLGTTTTVLHGNASGAPTFGAVSLTADVTGVLPTANGGTNLGGATPFTSGGVVYASSTSALATGSALTFDGFGSLALSNNNSGGQNEFSVTNTNTTGYAALAIKNTGASGKTYEAGVGGNGTAGNYQNNFYIRDTTGNATFALNLNNIIFIPGGTTEVARFTSTGLGIGTSTINERLAINGSSNATSRIRLYNQATELGAVGSQLGYLGSGGANDLLMYGVANTTVGSDGFVAFMSGGATERMRIVAAGDVGIGTSTPSSFGTKLAVSGAANVYGDERKVLAVIDTTSLAAGVGAGISFFGVSESGGGVSQFGSIKGIKENATSANYAGALAFVTSNSANAQTERMRLNSAGNLGLGVTPSVFTSTIKALQIGPTSVFRAGDTSYTQATFVASNVRQEAATDYYIADGFATQYTQQGGAHIWATAVSGTAGNAIAFSQKMFLDVNGNLGIGTTSPTTTLNVSGATSQTIMISNTSTSLSTGGSMGNLDFAAGTANTTNARVSGLVVGTSEAGGDLVVETRADGGSLSERMRITSTGNVGIGTSSPALGGARAYSKVLTIDGGTNTGIEETGALEVGSSTNVNDRLVGGITFFNRDNSGSGGSTRQQVGLIEAKCVTSNSNVNDDSGGTLVFLTKAEAGFVTEKMRLDSAGNLLVGTTSLIRGSRVSVLSATTQHGVSINIPHATADEYACLTLRRTASVGNLAEFYNQAESGLVGSISTDDTRTAYNTGSSSSNGTQLNYQGVKFQATQSASSDANTLDDYEEGTWTPVANNLTVVGSISYVATYTKIGRVVYINLKVNASTSSTSTANSTYFDGLPFEPAINSTVTAVNEGNIASLGVGLFANAARLFAPSWTAVQNATLSGFYYV